MKIDLKNKRLAINGGRPIRAKPWSDNLTTGKEEEKAAVRVIRSGYLSLFEGANAPDKPFSFYGGPEVQELEEMWCSHYGSRYAVAMNSATSGLYAALGALGIGYGDEVIVSPYTMSACAMASLIYGAIPVFADVEEKTGSLDPASVKRLISPRTRAILIVHQFGIPADMDPVMDLAKEHGLRVVEDCAQAHNAKYKGRFVGTIGDIGVFSLNVNKTIQTGEGGVCITNDKDLRYRLALIRNHGEAVVDAAGYDNITNIAGYNYRLTEIQAAMAKEQLKKLDALTKTRLELVERLNKGIKGIEFLKLPEGRKDCLSTYYVYPLRFIEGAAGVSRDEFTRALGAEGVKFHQGYVRPLYLQKIYQRKELFKNGYPFSAPANKGCRMEYLKGTSPVAERLHFKEMMINEEVRYPHGERDIDDIVAAIRKVEGKNEGS